ncbi:MAG: hypothetical protein HQ518_08245 [Rhodopirellula sp.]|nr:hypothetical protein [Rhodopirellula sp.]
MAKWLEKALGREEAEPIESVPFTRTCHCGFQTSGVRQERAKRIICAECGAAHFILPVNPYPTSERKFFAGNDQGQQSSLKSKPEPKRKSPATTVDLESTNKLSPSESTTDADDLFIDDELDTEPVLDLVEAAWSTGSTRTTSDEEEDLDDDGDDYELADSDAEIELTPQLPRKKKKKKTQPPTRPVREKSRASSKSDTRQEAKRESRIERPDSGEDRGGQRLRLAAVAALIVIVVVAMIAWVVHSRSLDQAEIAMREGRDLGEVALQQRDFVTAREKLGEAFRAMELLGIEEPTRLATRQLWLQAEAGYGLLDSTDVVEIALAAEATTSEPKSDEKHDDSDWQRQFHAQFFDRWLCIQLDPVAIVTGDEKFGKRVVFPAAPAIYLAGVDAVLDQQSGGRLWFAGPVKSCQRDPLDKSVWLIEFDSARVIACDGTESLVRPMLSEKAQEALIAGGDGSGESSSGNERQESNHE